MKYRTVYTDDEQQGKYVVTSSPNNENSVTTSNENFIIDTLDNTVIRLAAWGVDISYFWKTGLYPRIEPGESEEIDISDYNGVARKAFIYGLTVDYPAKQARFNTIVRHFDGNGDHITTPYDDEFVSRILNNDEIVQDGQGNDIGEFDYLYQIIESKTYSIFEIQAARVPILDAAGVFDLIY